MNNIVRIEERHLHDWIDMMLQLWEHDSYEVLKSEHINIINDAKYGNFICYDGDTAAGFINMSIRNDYVPGSDVYPVGYIEGLFVKAEYRRSGIASEMLKKGEQWAKEQGCRQIGSDCLIDNMLSYKFHIGLGFSEQERVVCFIKNIK